MSYSAAYSQAIEIILYISIKSKEGALKYLSIQSISEKLTIPVPSVKRLVAMLKNEGLITSKTGSSGGLMLAREAGDISLFDIFRAVEGSKKPLFNFYRGFDTSQFEQAQMIEAQLQYLENSLASAEHAMLEVLKKTSIEDIIRNR